MQAAVAMSDPKYNAHTGFGDGSGSTYCATHRSPSVHLGRSSSLPFSLLALGLREPFVLGRKLKE